MELQYDMVAVCGFRSWKNDAIESASGRFKINIGPDPDLEPLQAFKGVSPVALISFR